MVSEPAGRARLPNRRTSITTRITWHAPTGDAIDWHLAVGFELAPPHSIPREVFLRPAGAGRLTSTMRTIGDDAGEMLSLLLQHGYTPAHLARRFKPGSLGQAIALELDRLVITHAPPG